jgi:hypothetical protein
MHQIKQNAYLYDAALRLRFHRANRQLRHWLLVSEHLDLLTPDGLESLNRLSQVTFSARPDSLTYHYTYHEALNYGYGQALLSYIDANSRNLFYIPGVTHGAAYYPPHISPKAQLLPKVQHPQFIQMGRYGLYDNSLIKERFPGTPVWCIGPYIHYTELFYSPDRMRELKDKLGRVLLIFPSHNTEEEVLWDDHSDFIFDVFDWYKGSFDTFLICMYFVDLPKRSPNIPEEFRNRFLLTSAGLRSDQNFVRRLKSYITLSDMTLYNAQTTSIGFSLHLNKPVVMWPSGPERNLNFVKETNKERQSFKERLYELFPVDGREVTEEQLHFLEPFFGFSETKTKEEMSAILGVSKDIMKKCHGNAKHYHNAAMKMLQEYERRGDTLSYTLLSEAIARTS